MNRPPAIDLDDARRKLRELGYLDGRVERLVFARAFEGRRGLLLPALGAGALAAAVACVAAVASAEPDFAAGALPPAVLLVHLTVAFLIPAAALALAVGAVADRSRAPAAGAALASAAAAALIFALWIRGASGLGLASGLSASALLWGFPVALSALALAASVRSGFLARAYAHSRVLPSTRRRAGPVFAVAAAGLVVAAGVFTARPRAAPPAPLHVSPRATPVVVVAVDGVAGNGADPVGVLLAGASSGWWPQEPEAPPELWTTVATGVSARRHGVRALERVRPAGSASALRAPFGAGWYLRGVGPALGLVSSAPVSPADRRALAFWEVSASAGLPSAAVGWWASGPWPGAAVLDNRQILAEASNGEEADAAALGELARHDGAAVAAVYLAGPDILRSLPARRDREVARIADFIGRQAEHARSGDRVLIVVTGESHGGPGSLGRLSVFDGRVPSSMRIRATDVAPSVLARAGVPAASDLDGRPVPALFREGSLETATVPTYGARREPSGARGTVSDREYLKKLKALGYLN